MVQSGGGAAISPMGSNTRELFPSLCLTDEESDVGGDGRSCDKSLGLAVGFPRPAHHFVVFSCVSGGGTTGALKLKRLLVESFKSEHNG